MIYTNKVLKEDKLFFKFLKVIKGRKKKINIYFFFNFFCWDVRLNEL